MVKSYGVSQIAVGVLGLLTSTALGGVLARSSIILSKSVCLYLSGGPLGNKVVYPEAASGLYDGDVNNYYSLQERSLLPECIIRPSTTDDVSQAIRALSFVNRWTGNQVRFAVRSGGHALYAGAANIQAGITIDLRLINQTVIAPDRQTASIGSGATWGDVYLVLDAANLAVSGGRAAEVGVGGLTLGGGLSFYSPRKGFVCDNVIVFETVLATGEVINVTQSSNPDLWLALKGGSNNFGIVTRFYVEAFEQGKIWYGNHYFLGTTSPAQIDALYDLATAGDDYDPYSSVITSYAWTPQGSIFVDSLVYTKPEPNPSVYEPFTSIPGLITTTERITNLTDATIEVAGVMQKPQYQLFRTTTFKVDKEVMAAGFSLFDSTTPKIQNASGLVWSLGYQPLPQVITQKARDQGGNILGLHNDENNHALMIALIVGMWDNDTDSPIIESAAKLIIDGMEEVAQAQNVSSSWKYFNYCDKDQDPIAGYGADNVKLMQDVSRQYDPHGLFQTAMPGGFKVF